MSSPKIKVVLVDDHTILRNGIKSILSKDYKKRFDIVAEYSNGKEFLNDLENVIFDVVLLDLNMPVKGGENTLEILQLSHPNVRSIVLTQLSMDYMVESCARLGARAFLPKEVKPLELKRAIETVHAEGYYFNQLFPEETLQNLSSRKKKNEQLTLQEKRVLRHIVNGSKSHEIADLLGLSESTIKSHRENIHRKLNTSNPYELATYCIRNGIVVE
jgi:DNA-binding NarL/FixJ family response regulator